MKKDRKTTLSEDIENLRIFIDAISEAIGINWLFRNPTFLYVAVIISYAFIVFSVLTQPLD